MKKIALILFCFIASLNLSAQERPIWLDGNFSETSKSYLRVVAGSSKNSYDFARENALLQILKDNLISTDAEVKLQGELIYIEGEAKSDLKARVIDEYYEKEGYDYKAYLLVQIAKDKSYDFDKVTISDNYPFSARVFVPGLAQIYEGQKVKGACFMAGEIAFVGGIIVSHSMMKSNINKINATHNSSLKYQYTQNANTWMTMRNVSIAGAAAVYVWNIIDGIAAKGEKAVFLTNNNILISPYTDINTTGIAIHFKL